MNTRTEQNNLNVARRMANRYAKAQKMSADGYEFEQATLDGKAVDNSFLVRNPEGRFHCCNIESKTCTCEDYQKHKEPCKHVLWMEIQIDAQDAAACEASAEEYDAQRALLQTALVDNLLPGSMDGEDEAQQVTTVSAVLESLHLRIVADLEKAEARARDAKPGYREEQTRRMATLQCALDVLNEYEGREIVGRLNMTPATL